MKIYVSIIFFCVLFSCCKEKSTEIKGDNTVSGTILYQQKPVMNATVSLKGQTNLGTQTDPNGDFTFFNVPDGNYIISVEKMNSDSSILGTTSTISVTGDVDLQTLILPRGVKMYPIVERTSTSLSLSWNPSDAPDFREYKLYRHTTSGLDEATGTLAHVATEINDTVYLDANLDPLTGYFYRVYVMNDYGRLGGSNIVSSSTMNRNYVVNGDFENSADLLQWWNIGNVPWGTVGITVSTQKSGRFSLQLIAQPFSEYGVSGIRARIYSGSMIVAEGDYRISFWVKVEGMPSSVSSYNWYSFEGSDDYVAGLANDNMFPIGVKKGSVAPNEWTYVEKRVRLLDFYYAHWGFSFELRSYCSRAWFDDIKVEKAE